MVLVRSVAFGMKCSNEKKTRHENVNSAASFQSVTIHPTPTASVNIYADDEEDDDYELDENELSEYIQNNEEKHVEYDEDFDDDGVYDDDQMSPTSLVRKLGGSPSMSPI